MVKTAFLLLSLAIALVIVTIGAEAFFLRRGSGAGGSPPPPQTIASISPTTCPLMQGTSATCPLTIAMSPSSPAYSGTIALVASNAACSGTNDTTDFGVTQTPYAITYNGSAVAGSYNVCVQAAQPTLASAYQSVAITIAAPAHPVSITFATTPGYIADSATGGQVGTTFTVNMSDSSTYQGTPTGACLTQSPCPWVVGGGTGNWSIQTISGGLNSSYDATSLTFRVTAN